MGAGSMSKIRSNSLTHINQAGTNSNRVLMTSNGFNSNFKQSTGSDSLRRPIVNSNRSVRISSVEDPRGTVQRVIIDGDTKHNTPNRIIRSRAGSVTSTNYNGTGPDSSVRNSYILTGTNNTQGMNTPLQSKLNKEVNLRSSNQQSASWRKAGSRGGDSNTRREKKSSLKKIFTAGDSTDKEKELSKTRVYVTDGFKSKNSSLRSISK